MTGFVQNGTIALLLLFFLATCTNFDACGAGRSRHSSSSSRHHHHYYGGGGSKPTPSPAPSPLSPPPLLMSNPTSTLDRPALSGMVFNVVDFGARGDGVTDDTKVTKI